MTTAQYPWHERLAGLRPLVDSAVARFKEIAEAERFAGRRDRATAIPAAAA